MLFRSVDLLLEARNASSSTVKAGADVKAPANGEPAKVGIGPSVGVNVGVNTTIAEVEAGAKLQSARNATLSADADHTLGNTVEGGAAGGKVAVTPVAAITVGVNTTRAKLAAGDDVVLTGAYLGSATHKA